MEQRLSFVPFGGALSGPISLGARLVRVVTLVLAWRERTRSRRLLAGLDNRVLRDIGIDRAIVEREVSKPFWQA